MAGFLSDFPVAQNFVQEKIIFKELKK